MFHRRFGSVPRVCELLHFLQGRFPEKSCRFLLDLINNAAWNAEQKALDMDNLEVAHVQVCVPCCMSTD